MAITSNKRTFPRCYGSAVDLAEYLEGKGMDHVRGAPHHPQTQGKIERWHQTMKNRVLSESYFLARRAADPRLFVSAQSFQV